MFIKIGEVIIRVDSIENIRCGYDKVSGHYITCSVRGGISDIKAIFSDKDSRDHEFNQLSRRLCTMRCN